jgi:hypothetical protein
MADQGTAGRDSAPTPPDRIRLVEEVVGPLLEPLAGHGLVVRLTIGVRTPYQIDVVKVTLVDEGGAPIDRFTYEAYEADLFSPPGRVKVDTISVGDVWHATPLAAFMAGVAALEIYDRSV